MVDGRWSMVDGRWMYGWEVSMVGKRAAIGMACGMRGAEKSEKAKRQDGREDIHSVVEGKSCGARGSRTVELCFLMSSRNV
jgi:hypothetical protein